MSDETVVQFGNLKELRNLFMHFRPISLLWHDSDLLKPVIAGFDTIEVLFRTGYFDDDIFDNLGTKVEEGKKLAQARLVGLKLI